MSSTFNESSALQHFESSNGVEICKEIMLDFYPQLQEFIVCNSHMVSTPAIWRGWRRQSAVNMLSCENTAVKRRGFCYSVYSVNLHYHLEWLHVKHLDDKHRNLWQLHALSSYCMNFGYGFARNHALLFHQGVWLTLFTNVFYNIKSYMYEYLPHGVEDCDIMGWCRENHIYSWGGVGGAGKIFILFIGFQDKLNNGT